MTLEIDITSFENNLKPAERAIMAAIPPMVEKQFAKVVTTCFAAGLLKVDDEEKHGLDVRIVIAALYASIMNIASGRGSINLEKTQAKVESTLRELFEKASFTAVDAPKTEGCGQPDCEACSAEAESEAAPSGVTKH